MINNIERQKILNKITTLIHLYATHKKCEDCVYDVSLNGELNYSFIDHDLLFFKECGDNVRYGTTIYNSNVLIMLENFYAELIKIEKILARISEIGPEDVSREDLEYLNIIYKKLKNGKL